jgi:glycosyltransferase involved in cell wall biosynthesis
MPDYAVSVCLITYNQVDFIRKAIDSILMQKVNFTWEIIIADDLSTDGTREIVKEYQEKHPQLIKLVPRSKNVGPGINFIELIYSAKGKYISYLEGDDYWIDDKKLQKQFDALEANPDCTICFHRIYEIQGHSDKKTIVDLVPPNSLERTKYSILDLARNNFIPSLSLFFVNGLFKEFPSWYLGCPAGDYALHLLNAKKGDIYFIPEFMGVYRRHINGTWGPKESKYQLEKLLISLDYLLEEFKDNEQVRPILEYQYARYCSEIGEIEFRNGNETVFHEILKKSFSRSELFMNDYLSGLQKRYDDIRNSQEYKIGWALKNPGFMLRKLASSIKTK